MYEKTKFLTAGEKAVVIEFGNEISSDINIKVRSMMIAVQNYNWNFVDELIPTYRSLMIQYNPLLITYDVLIQKLQELEKNLSKIDIPSPNVIEIPVCYGHEYGEDLLVVSEHNGIKVEDVINIHTSTNYLIYMIGFTPGFPYLGGMDEKIATPRLAKPRIKIDAGSVGIAGSQTGVYPVDSPGGWQIIGRTPVKLYDAERETPILLKTGDYIKFTSVSRDEYLKIKEEVENNEYVPNIYAMEEVI